MVAATIAGAGLVALALVALRLDGEEVDEEARGHAEAACDLTSKAEEAARVDTGARLAAAVLLLDRAMIESARAADDAEEYADLDQAVKAVHAAAHRGIPGPWRDALDNVLTACRDSVGNRSGGP